MAAVVLNVYDLVVDGSPLTKLNDKTKRFGFGAFHTGVQVFGQEISFGVLTGPAPFLPLQLP